MVVRFPPMVANAILRIGMVLLLAYGVWAWALLLGLADAGVNFDTLPSAGRNLAVLLATVCPVAAVGTWFVSDWGPVLWAMVVVALGVTANAASVGPWVGWAFALHGLTMLLWVVAKLLVERRAEA